MDFNCGIRLTGTLHWNRLNGKHENIQIFTITVFFAEQQQQSIYISNINIRPGEPGTNLNLNKMKANTETKAHIESKLQNGHNLKSIYNYLLANLDEFGCANINYSEHGFKLSYTSNDNFQQGAKNGGGRGMYAHLKRCGFYQTVKIEL